MDTLGKFMLVQSTEIQCKFSHLLSEIWSDYLVLQWNLGRSMSVLMVKNALLSSKNNPKIVKFLKDNLEETQTLNDVCKGLLLWEQISPFLVITSISDIDKHEKLQVQFINNLKRFYVIGGRTFLTKNADSHGDNKTFYSHVLRNYLPEISKQTLKDHNLGLCIFTMQGFESFNKESKNCFKRFCNYRGNICVSIMGRLWDVFCHGKNNV